MVNEIELKIIETEKISEFRYNEQTINKGDCFKIVFLLSFLLSRCIRQEENANLMSAVIAKVVTPKCKILRKNTSSHKRTF